MSNIVHSETPGARRNKLLKLLVNLMPDIQSPQMTAKKRNDIIAFVMLTLDEVEKSVEDTLKPWEKRGYWTKADQFRLEWEWIAKVSREIAAEETDKGWSQWPGALGDLFARLASVKPTRKKLGAFWEGSYQRYLSQK
ncbi:MAG: hypothetical protein PWQ55_2190 [Chloroflexota bacterium]|nr:hypothetical protein [Chloroflexota bacterium]